MQITNKQIAKSAMCTEGAVRAAMSNSKLDKEDLDSILAFVLLGRLKSIGLDGVTGVTLEPDFHPMEDHEWGA